MTKMLLLLCLSRFRTELAGPSEARTRANASTAGTHSSLPLRTYRLLEPLYIQI